MTILLRLALSLGLMSGAAAASSLEGRVSHVRDVDTIEVRGTAVRLNGVDGPELDTAMGQRGKSYMRDLVGGRVVRCDLNGERNGDRLIGVCYLEGRDIGALAIAAGFALDCRRYSGGRYADLEQRRARDRIRRARYC